MSDAASFASRPGKLWLGGKGTSGDGRAKDPKGPEASRAAPTEYFSMSTPRPEYRDIAPASREKQLAETLVERFDVEPFSDFSAK